MATFKKQEVDYEREVIRLYLGKPNRLDDFETLDILTPLSHEAGKRHWEKYREAVLGEWIKLHPGTRPWAWWKYDAPESARQWLGGSGCPLMPAGWQETKRIQGGLLHFGVPTQWRVLPDPADPPVFESQVAYLHRLGLLTDEEQNLPPAAFAPLILGPEWYGFREYLPFGEKDFPDYGPCLR